MSTESSAKESLDSGNFLFRFRSAKALLEDDPEKGGFEELEKQTIYFATPESLNDPMEGLTDAFWDGDKVLWENTFRHYALSLIWYSGAWLLSTSKENPQNEVRTGLTEEDLPTDSFRKIYREFASGFCAEIDAKGLAKALGQHTEPLRRERFTNLLFLVHRSALHHLFRVLKKHGLCQFDLPPQKTATNNPNPATTIVNCWEELLRNPPSDEMSIKYQLEFFGRSANQINGQLELEMLSRADRQEDAQKWIAIMGRFPEKYAEAFLRDLHFTPWRVACFSQRAVNASMWGTYGHEHRGAALVFRTTERDGKRFFRVHGMTGTGGRGQELEVQPVVYQRFPPPLDSFLEIGMLPMPKLQGTWMVSGSGIASVRLSEITNDVEAWRKAHWQKHVERSTWKHPDWKHEAEARLIASTAFTDDPAPKPLTYDFSQLEGIIFGMRMSVDDKLRIAKIVERKCRAEGKADFRFFQTHYSPEKGEMAVDELGLLKFEG
jgi:hypothetical protein